MIVAFGDIIDLNSQDSYTTVTLRVGALNSKPCRSALLGPILAVEI